MKEAVAVYMRLNFSLKGNVRSKCVRELCWRECYCYIGLRVRLRFFTERRVRKTTALMHWS